MQSEFVSFLKDKCKFNETNMNQVLNVLQDCGIEGIESLSVCSEEDLINLGLSKFQALILIKNRNFSVQNSVANEKPTKIESKKVTSVDDESQSKEKKELFLIYEEEKKEESQSEIIDQTQSKIDESQLKIEEEEKKDNSAFIINEDNEIKEDSKSSHSFQNSDQLDQSMEIIDTFSKSFSRSGRVPAVGKRILRSAPKFDSVLAVQDQYLLFQSYEDSSSEYKMNKIRLIESEFNKLFKDIKSETLQVIGFYGYFQGCYEMATAYLKKDLPLAYEFDEGLIALKHLDKIAIIFKTNENLYEFKRSTDSSHLATTYLRYLIDVCHNLIAVPAPSFQLNPDLKNPYQDYVNPGFQMKEMIIKPDDKVSVKEIVADEKIKYIDFSVSNASFDNQKFISKVEYSRQVLSENIKLSLCKRDLYPSEKNISNSRDFYDYDEIKRIILKVWPLDLSAFYQQHDPRRFQHQTIKVLGEFVKFEQREFFRNFVADLQDQYTSQYQELRETLQLEYDIELEKIYQEFIDYLDDIHCDKYKEYLKLLNENEEPQGYFSKMISVFKSNPKEEAKCTITKCQSHSIQFIKATYHRFKIDWALLIRLYEKKYGSKWLDTHKNHSDEFQDKLKNLENTTKEQEDNFYKERKIRFISLRQSILDKLFSQFETFVSSTRENIINSITVQFQSMNIIRDSEHQISSWNVNKIAIPLSHRFGKDSQGVVNLKQIYFVTDTAGLVVFSNSPDGKSSVFYFNIGSKTQVIFQHMLSLSSVQSFLVVEPSLKQWFIYDNLELRANIGKLTNQGKIEDGVPTLLYNQMSDGIKIESIISACFLPYGDKLLLLNQSHHLFEYKWQSRQLNILCKKVNKDGYGVEKIMIKPADQDDTYNEIQTSSDGKNIILKSDNNIDIYDLNLDKIYTFELKRDDFLFFKSFTDKINNFIVIFGRRETKCFQLVGLSETKTLQSQILGKQKDRSLGNPIVDYLYQAFKKFGPHSEFIGSPSQTLLCVLQNGVNFNINNLKKYFQSLNLQNVSLKISNLKRENIDKSLCISEDDSLIEVQKLKMILLGRIAIHVATIENFTLVPLQNGINISDQIAESLIQNSEKSSDLIERIIEMIKFGIYENILRDIKTELYVVSIVGRQSSGKSYVMNRIFGTRFNVAATRCTDGIWMSIVEIYHEGASKIFVLLDCEGLFSARRNEQEEMKLCLALSAISDVMILNQDLAFNRYLNQLFNNFTKSIGRIKGKKLFKGCLMMLVRDVKSEEAEAAYKELQSNFIQMQSNKQDGFLGAVFQGNLKSQCLNYFQQPIFGNEIDMVREQYFLSLESERWTNGLDFLESFKITLAQVFSDDDTDMDIHKLKISCENLYLIALHMFFNGGVKFQGDESIFKGDYTIKGETYSLKVNQADIKLLQDINEFEDDQEKSSLTEEVISQFQNQTQEYSLSIHNDWFKGFTSYIDELLEQRKKYILKFFSEHLPQDIEFSDIVKSYEYKLKDIFETYILKIRYCDKICRNCARQCSLKLNHKNNCNCETQHICEEICNKTDECLEKKYLCLEVYGHEKEHRCGEGNHKCSHFCKIGKECKYLCQYEGGHPEDETHNCGNRHPCAEKCADSFCTRTCQFDNAVEHTEHICGETKCIHKCSLCEKQCMFPNHLHQLAIESEEEDKIKHKEGEKFVHLSYHICGSDHLCKDICEERGVCSIDYKIEEKIWKNEFGEFTYPYFQPLQNRNVCKIMIPAFKKSHDDYHSCKIGTHRCYHQCPECKSFCNKDIDHEDFHSTNAHRNKENSVFVSSKGKDKISFIAEGKKREYKIGESCQPENCATSCGRKGRAHYHLKECKEEDKCEGKVNPFVRHTTDKFHPFTEKVFDKWLCTNYWNSLNWKAPIEGAQLEEIQSCNFVCTHHSHGETYKFCNGTAWHSDAHTFDCDHGGTFSTNIIDVAFCCDTTGSMSSYIEKSKTTIKKIINDLKGSKGVDRSLKFAFVAYRDHPPQDKTYVTRCQGLTDDISIITFIDTVKAAGGGDGPEAVMDGLYDSVFKIDWRKDSMRYLFHIADAPPHGNEYTKGSGDGFPSGCPCGIKIETIATQLKAQNIRYKLLKIGSYPNTMAAIFKSKIEDYEESDLDSAVQLELKVAEILIRDIRTEEEDIVMD